ncbi:MAG TPA: hypothetical protein VMR52_08285 [Dehalococcoidia bacterium]|nr:hypothetical protein [Dehalococcoidia bacterium]
MPQFVHVAKILPGQTEAFLATIKTGFETGAPALKAAGLTCITAFHSPEADSGEGGLLVTIYEADDPQVIRDFFSNPAIVAAEERNHGTLVTPHSHDAVPTNTPFLELDLS